MLFLFYANELMNHEDWFAPMAVHVVLWNDMDNDKIPRCCFAWNEL